MIPRKNKKCKSCSNNQHPIFGHGLCKYCYNKKKAIEYKEKKIAASKESKKEKIKQVSDKQKERLKEYKKARIDFLLKKDHCEVATDGCRVPYPVYNPTEVLTLHHKCGRIGPLLTDERYFLTSWQFVAIVIVI
jgi:hypothetical protein